MDWDNFTVFVMSILIAAYFIGASSSILIGQYLATH